jgi:outer membrane protein assembly factor BamE (lipoprotein component of BamABCDE complex)
MTTFADTAGPSKTPPGADRFLRDEMGQRLFYPFGLSWSGYVLPSAQHEASVRDAMASCTPIASRCAGWIAVAGLGLFVFALYVFSTYPFAVVAAVVLPTLLTIGYFRIVLLYHLRPLLNGLEQVESREKIPRYTRLLFLAACATVWFTLQSFQDRLSQLSAEPGTKIYYDGISQPLALALLVAFVLVMIVSLRNGLVTIFGNKVNVTMLALAGVEVSLIAYTVLAIRTPVPRVFVTSSELICNQHTKWSSVTDVAEVSRGTRTRSGQYAQLKLDNGQFFPGNYTRCKISGLNEDYDTIYRAIRAAWLATRRGPAGVSTGDTLLDQIDIGATRQQVLNVYGSPTITARTPSGSMLLYYPASDANAAPAERIITAVYFGSDDKVERLARYGVKNGKIFDSISQRELTSGVEYPFLETLLFSKAHGG